MGKKKQLTPYQETLSGKERHTLSGRLDGGIKSLPLPTSFALDAKSLKFTGVKPQIFVIKMVVSMPRPKVHVPFQ